MARIRKTDTCWLWSAYLTPKGYGHIFVGGHHVAAHRFAYEFFVGPIPDGLTIDHLCKVRHCVNPAHLEPVTQAVNASRGIHFGVPHPGARGTLNVQGRKTHCAHGHAYDETNTRWTPYGQRVCRTCRKRISREHEARRPKRDYAAERRASKGRRM